MTAEETVPRESLAYILLTGIPGRPFFLGGAPVYL